MTKADIVNEIATTTGIDKVSVLAMVEQFMVVVKDSLAHGENVYLRGFGTFQVKERAEKTARNISKNTTIVIPAHNIPFSPCARLSFTTTINCSTTARTLALSIPVVFAISFTISALVILRTYLI